MKINYYLILLSCLGFISVGCASTSTKVVDAKTENISDITKDKQSQLYTESSTTVADAKKAIIWNDAGTKENNIPPVKPILSGIWVLNKELSDNPHEKIRESREQTGNSKSKNSMESSRGGKGSGGRGGGGKRGGGTKNADSGVKKASGGGQKSLPQELYTFLNTSQILELKHEEPLLTIIVKDGKRQRVYTDFRGASVSASGGMHQKVITAGWEGDVLVVETTTDSTSYIQRYRLVSGDNRLWVSTTILTSSLSIPVKFNRVYELAKIKSQRSMY